MFDREKKEEAKAPVKKAADQKDKTTETPIHRDGVGLFERLTDVPKPEDARLQQSLLQLQKTVGNRICSQALSEVRHGDEAEADPSIEAAIHNRIGSGNPLEKQVQQRMEKSFGTDFSGVRVHSGSDADRLNRSLESQAFTTGKDIFFRGGEYRPETSTGSELLAHELTHVVQQDNGVQGGRMKVGRPGDIHEREADMVSRDVMRHQRQGDVDQARNPTVHNLSAVGRRVQRRLRFTGTAAHRARVLTILNGGLFGYTVASDSSGNITIAANQDVGPPSPEQTALYTRLNTVISDSSLVNIAVESGGRALGGNYATNTIDVADLEAFGTGRGLSAVGALIHEVEEQYRKQLSGQSYATAHAGALVAETEQSGATRGTERFLSTTTNADGTINAVVEVPYTYPDGTTVTLTLTISHNNITRVTRR